MLRLRAIFIIFISLFCHSIKAQTVEQTYKTADSLMQLKQYAQAEVLLKKLTYFADTSNYLKIYTKAADCYAELDDYNAAAEHYAIASRYANSFAAQNELLFNEVKMRTLQKQGVEALDVLSELYSLDTNELKRYYLYTAVNYMAVFRQDSSIHYFTKLAKLTGVSESDEFKKIVKKHRKAHKPKPQKAKVLSYILPGAGQMYSGDVKNSINSLVINGIFFTLFYNTAVTYTVADALIGVSGWTFRYYKGGALSAYDIALEKQQKKKDKLLMQYLALFANSYP